MAQFTNMPPTFVPIQIVDVTSAVGGGRPNSRADVMLVQFALNKIMAAPGGRGQLPDITRPAIPGPLGATFPSLAPLAVDGFFGSKTLAAIRAYQSASIAGSSALKTDGAVDPVHTFLTGITGDPIGGGTLNVVTKVGRFTMFKLNADILKLFGKVIQDAELPPLVQASLRTRRRGS